MPQEENPYLLLGASWPPVLTGEKGWLDALCVLCCTSFPPVRAGLPCREALLVRATIVVMKHRDMGGAALFGLCFHILVHLQQGRSLKASG